MIDIVTVVFRDELPILKLQAQSIDLYCQAIGLKSIYVVVNDDDSVAKEIDTAWWGTLSNRVRIINRSIFSTEFVNNGWVSQQVLKLLTSAISFNNWSMVLDAKTIFVKPIELNHVLNAQGQLNLSYYPIQLVFEPSKKIVSELFDIDLLHVAEPLGVPFFFHNCTVRSMIACINNLTGKEFPIWFQEQGMVTEFILYSGYIVYRDHTMDLMYAGNQNSIALCSNVCHSEILQFDNKFQNMLDSITVSVHRNAWKGLTDQQKTIYCDFLYSRGITLSRSLIQ
jgi:hypothetical protein